MKDPHDPGTIDGFADLLESLENNPPEEQPKMAPESKFPPEVIALAVAQIEAAIRRGDLEKPKRGVGRPPKGACAQTPAEKQKAYRDRMRAARDAAK